jgi:hypothetical protein
MVVPDKRTPLVTEDTDPSGKDGQNCKTRKGLNSSMEEHEVEKERKRKL